MSQGRLPDFLIIGGMKCGTTTLFRHLAQHPAITPCKQKEPGYFSKVAWDKGLDWYRSLFPVTDQLTFEASTAYAKHPNFGNVPERIAQTLPDVKLIYSIRHPVDRVRSELVHNVRAGRMKATRLHDPQQLRESMQFPIQCSRYFWQITQYLEYFDREQICIVSLEEIVQDPAGMLNQILKFLEIPAGFFSEDMPLRNYNASGRRSLRHFWQKWKTDRTLKSWKLPPEHADEVWEQCVEDIAALENFIGRSLQYRAPAESGISRS